MTEMMLPEVVNINLWAHELCHWCGRINIKCKKHEYFSYSACVALCVFV